MIIPWDSIETFWFQSRVQPCCSTGVRTGTLDCDRCEGTFTGDDEPDRRIADFAELAAAFPGWVQVTGLLPPWASQLPLLVVLHPVAIRARQVSSLIAVDRSN